MNQRMQILNARRKRLGMSYAVLAARSGVSPRSVVRILSGRDPHASWHNTLAIAQALGMSVILKETTRIEDMLERQAREKSEEIMNMVQGTSGLEGQGLDKKRVLERMKRQTVHELLAGSRRTLWSE
jgi:transcriptional regulator with XRE-family HTH domain